MEVLKSGRRDELRATRTYGWVVGRSSRRGLTCEEAYVFLLAQRGCLIVFMGDFALGVSS